MLVCISQAYNANTVVGLDGMTDATRFMKSISKYCDSFVFFDDGSTDGTREVIGAFGNRLEIQILSNKKNRRELQWMNRARCLEHTRRLNAEWVFALKMDETIEPMGENGGLAAAIRDSRCSSLAFSRRHFWRSDKYVRMDNRWSLDFPTRAFKSDPNLRYKTQEGRSSLIPDNLADDTSLCKLSIVHYGFSTESGIERHRNNYVVMASEKLDELSQRHIQFCCTPQRLLSEGKSYGPCIADMSLKAN